MSEPIRILMIDDDEDFIRSVRWVLEAEGYRFFFAQSEKDGIEAVEQADPALIILDVMMEDMTAGFRFLGKLRNTKKYPRFERFAGVPILMLTSISKPSMLKLADEIGAKLLPTDAFEEKPIPLKRLLVRVRELLAQP